MNTANEAEYLLRNTRHPTTMKNLFLALAFAAVALFSTVSAEAGYRDNHCTSRVYKIRTCEVDRCSYKKWAYDHCGKRYSYLVTVVTYKTFYSDGSYKIWKNTIS
ncbi:MAG: hypothetical protein CMO55_10635 [Verrucomicrobiales bacterium]|nr:hypothetical protein [Verrucomicrobiales bacterium]